MMYQFRFLVGVFPFAKIQQEKPFVKVFVEFYYLVDLQINTKKY